MPERDLTIRAMVAVDWPEVSAIYEAGIATGNATFEAEAPAYEEWDRSHLGNLRLVTHASDGTILGWAALSPVSDRCVYGGVAENSIYIHPDTRGNGIGTVLLSRLISMAEAAGIWTVQTGIFPTNAPSLALHQRCGFRIVGTRERIGRLNGAWRDTLLLERRSVTVGR